MQSSFNATHKEFDEADKEITGQYDLANLESLKALVVKMEDVSGNIFKNNAITNLCSL